MSRNKIYFDHNATSFALPEVIECVSEMSQRAYNPSSIHYNGREARKLLEEARNSILSVLSAAEDYQLIFTSSGTEANNLFVHNSKHGTLFISSVEHASINEQIKHHKHIKIIRVHSNGLLDLEDLEFRLKSCKSKDKFVSVMLANNETGVIQDIGSIAKISRKYGAIIHTDAVQAFGKIEIDISKLDVDFMTISAHKIGGITGSAALIKKKDLIINPMIIGGMQEQGLRAGTENVIGNVAFAKASSMIKETINKYRDIEKIRDFIEKEIISFTKEAKIYAKNSQRIPNTSCIAMPRVRSEIQLMHFDLENILVSAGSACSSGKISSSHVLSAMDLHDQMTPNAIRISLGPRNNLFEAHRFVNAWKDIYTQSSMDKSHAVIY